MQTLAEESSKVKIHVGTKLAIQRAGILVAA